MCMQNRLPLNNLNTFAAAAEHLSFQDAAESLFVTPSAVSHQIRNLEKLLGYPLFERLDKSVRLTRRGETLFADIRDPMRQLHEASHKAFRGLADNTLTLSVAPVVATGWLMPRLKDFYAKHPDINLSVIITTDMIEFNNDALKTDSLDASIRIGHGKWPDVDVVRLFGFEIVAVCHPSLIAQKGRLLTPEEVLQNTLIQNTSAPALWRAWFRSAGVTNTDSKDAKFQVQNAAQMTEAIQSGEGIGLIDKKFIRQDLESGRLAIASEHVSYGKDGYHLVSPKSARDMPALQRFREWILRQPQTRP